MKKIILAIVASLVATSAFAADMPPKKIVLKTANVCTALDCTGLYVGFNFAGTITNANVIGNGINGSLNGGGSSFGIDAGYQFWNGTWFFGPEVVADFTVAGTSAMPGYSPPKWFTGEFIKVGAPLSTFFGPQTPVSTNGLPALLVNSIMSPYILVGSVQRTWGAGIAAGAGLTFNITNNWFADFKYVNVQYTGGNTVQPGTTVPQENLALMSIDYKF